MKKARGNRYKTVLYSVENESVVENLGGWDKFD